jgi:hypothetical protein
MNMRKLKLSLDDLRVDSFHATDAEGRRGTVPAHAWTEYADESCFQSCNGGCTVSGPCGGCGGSYSCGGTCWNSCNCPPNTDYTACDCQTWETCPNATICA